MREELARRVRQVLDHIASGNMEADEIGNLIRDLVWALRLDVGESERNGQNNRAGTVPGFRR